MLMATLVLVATASGASAQFGRNTDAVYRIIQVSEYPLTPQQIAQQRQQAQQPAPPAQPGQPAQPAQPPRTTDQAVSFGTGFLVSGRRFVVTNNHVVNSDRTVNNQVQRAASTQYGIAFLRNRQAVVVIARLVATLPDKDLALLEASEDLPGSPVTLGDFDTSRDTDVEAVGFPGIADFAFRVSQGGSMQLVNAEILEPIKTQGRVQRFFEVKDGRIGGAPRPITAQVLLHTAAISGGNSGGPLYNKCGQMIGVNTFSSFTTEGSGAAQFSHSIAAKEVVRFLAAQPAVQARSATSFCPGSFISDYTNVQTVLAAAAMLLGLAALIIAKQRPQVIQQTVSRVQNTFSRINRTPSPGSGSGSGSASNHGAAARPADVAPSPPRGGTQAPSVAPRDAAPRRAINPAGPVVRLVPTTGGAALEIAMNRLTGGQAIVVGRSLELMQEQDPHDHPIVIADKTVSRRHARLTLDDRNRLVIEDLESSAGTFKGSQKITTASFAHGEEVKFGSVAYRIALPASN